MTALHTKYILLTNKTQVGCDTMKCIPTLQKCISSHCNLDLWPLTLKTFSVMPTNMVNICGKFDWNPSSK